MRFAFEFPLSNAEENVRLVVYSAAAFLVPFLLEGPQLLVGRRRIAFAQSRLKPFDLGLHLAAAGPVERLAPQVLPNSLLRRYRMCHFDLLNSRL